jgi:hypothetical protein
VQGCSGDEVLQGTPRSRRTTTPVSYVSIGPISYPFGLLALKLIPLPACTLVNFLSVDV